MKITFKELLNMILEPLKVLIPFSLFIVFLVGLYFPDFMNTVMWFLAYFMLVWFILLAIYIIAKIIAWLDEYLIKL